MKGYPLSPSLSLPLSLSLSLSLSQSLSSLTHTLRSIPFESDKFLLLLKTVLELTWQTQGRKKWRENRTSRVGYQLNFELVIIIKIIVILFQYRSSLRSNMDKLYWNKYEVVFSCTWLTKSSFNSINASKIRLHLIFFYYFKIGFKVCFVAMDLKYKLNQGSQTRGPPSAFVRPALI